MKQSEAKLIIYLNQVDPPLKYIMKISNKLDMDYGYVFKVLNAMFQKGWVKKRKSLSTNKMFYDLTQEGKSLINSAIKTRMEVKQ